MSLISTTFPHQRLGAAGAIVIIVIVITAAALVLLTPDATPMSPASVLRLVATTAFIGVVTVRLTVVGSVSRLRSAAAHILAPASPQG